MRSSSSASNDRAGQAEFAPHVRDVLRRLKPLPLLRKALAERAGGAKKRRMGSRCYFVIPDEGGGDGGAEGLRLLSS